MSEQKQEIGYYNNSTRQVIPGFNALFNALSKSHKDVDENNQVKHIENIDGYYASSFYELHSQLLEKGDDKTIGLHSEKLFTVAETNDYSWKRYNAAKVIYNAAEMLRKRGDSGDLLLSLDKKIAEIKASEPNKKILNLYRGW